MHIAPDKRAIDDHVVERPPGCYGIPFVGSPCAPRGSFVRFPREIRRFEVDVVAVEAMP